MSISNVKWEPQDQYLQFSTPGPNYAPSIPECYSNPSEHDINVYEEGEHDLEQDFEQDHKYHEHPKYLNQHTFHSIDRPIMYTPYGPGNNASNYSGQDDSDDLAEDPYHRVHQEMDLMMANELGLTPRPQSNAYNASYTYNTNANMAPYQYYSNTTAYYSYPVMQSPDATSPGSASMNSNSSMMQRPQYANTPQYMHDPRFSNSPQYNQGSPYTYSPYPMHGIQYPNTPSASSPPSSDRRDSYQSVGPHPSTELQGTQETRPTEPGFTPLPPFDSIRSPVIPAGSEGIVDGGGDGESEIESEMESEPPRKSRKSLPAAKLSTTKTSIAEEKAAKLASDASKKHHNEVEKSYRVRLNSCIDELSITIYGSPRKNGTGKSRSSASVFKHSKAIVIAAAKSNIEDMRSKNAKLAQENEELKRKLAIYEHNTKPRPGGPDGDDSGDGKGHSNENGGGMSV